jgi:hypothetical protein
MYWWGLQVAEVQTAGDKYTLCRLCWRSSFLKAGTIRERKSSVVLSPCRNEGTVLCRVQHTLVG